MIKLIDLFKKQTASQSTTQGERQSRHPTPTAQPDWSRVRAPQHREDQVLLGPTYAWLKTLPYGVRPVELCSRYPRVGNQLANCWSDPTRTERLFNELLIDRRGKRKGFPPLVAQELLRLRRFHDYHRDAEDQSTDWDFRSPTPDP
jgi:hypothetical protein